MLTWWQALILGLTEGITEFLPVSSTGHLILVSSFLGLDGGAHHQAVTDLEIIAQGGTVLAVVFLYRERVRTMLLGILGRDAPGLRLTMLLAVAFMPSAILGLLFGDAIEARLFAPGPVIGALALGGLLMLVVARLPKWRPVGALTIETLSVSDATLIGLAQCLALWPGTSRSMTTMVAGILLGFRAAHAAEFSFLLGVLTLSAASSYKLLDNLLHAHQAGTPNLFSELGATPTVLCLLVAAVSGFLAARWLLGFLNRRGLFAFGLYRIALAAVLASMGQMRF